MVKFYNTLGYTYSSLHANREVLDWRDGSGAGEIIQPLKDRLTIKKLREMYLLNYLHSYSVHKGRVWKQPPFLSDDKRLMKILYAYIIKLTC